MNRLRRLKGQLDALERSVDADSECARVLQQAACRGALDGFIAEVIEDHIRGRLMGEGDRAAAEDWLPDTLLRLPAAKDSSPERAATAVCELPLTLLAEAWLALTLAL